MTVEDVRRRFQEILRIAHDDEAAHAEEDRLYEEVLRAIANGECEDPASLARESLKTGDIDFSRWYA